MPNNGTYVRFAVPKFGDEYEFKSKPDLFQDKKGHWIYLSAEMKPTNLENAKFQQWQKE